MSDLRSAPVPPLSAEDHVRGPADAPLLIEYGDLECAFCAALHARLEQLRASTALRVVYRHFPVRSSHPRAWPAACATEAAGRQGAFWEMHDAILADQGHIEDPHLWALAERLGLDLERFERDRRSDAVAARVRADFTGGVRAGVVTTPTVFRAGEAFSGASLRSMVANWLPI
ncbi:MAG TPA: thioredoxin domain-containing protein [Solirubrobacteraceae bacterium]|jgi:protein-disulfide isomerase|nr:thioredoxin domain-containing protein [Solirubrobacteraceae bacterium]